MTQTTVRLDEKLPEANDFNPDDDLSQVQESPVAKKVQKDAGILNSPVTFNQRRVGSLIENECDKANSEHLLSKRVEIHGQKFGDRRDCSIGAYIWKKLRN
ncbi:hypothetical protein QT972_09850 [Microcoleus sp. herbarium7]|uniref:hypothetical protein n=1 Tax=Microcoleus sp. herbarium7 TaxID=3055435 RepID=UPI002FCFAED2